MHWILIVPYANLHLHTPLPWPPLPCPHSASCPAGGGVSLAGLGARQVTSGLWRAAALRPSPCSLAPAGVSSGSPACQSDLTQTERGKKIMQAAVHAFFTLQTGQHCKQINQHWLLVEWNFIITIIGLCDVNYWNKNADSSCQIILSHITLLFAIIWLCFRTK